jgi:[NiFe] hydrogenase diaphorase moiety small subunit
MLHERLIPRGSCRVCTVNVNGREQAACTQPVTQDMVVENETERLLEFRRSIIEMLFVEGNHFCMFCEKSGNCELQALLTASASPRPGTPISSPRRNVDASHPDIFLDRNRCVLCGRCVTASRDMDGKSVFEFVERGIERHIAVNAEARLADTDMALSDKAADVCPVGAILKSAWGTRRPWASASTITNRSAPRSRESR